MKNGIDTVIFDLGGVFIDWNPEYLYRKIIADEKERKYFLSEICNHDWNIQQDAGRSLQEATELLVESHPEYEVEIRAFYDRWDEMLGEVMQQTVEILEHLHQKKDHQLFALTNWSAETFPYALQHFDFLNLFEGILVSGEVKMKKPDQEIYSLFLDRFHVIPNRSVFIDDSLENIEGAELLNIKGIHFQSPEQLKIELENIGVL